MANRRPVRGPALPVYAVEPLAVANPTYVRGPAEPVYFVRRPDGSYIPGSMIDPSTINHNALANLTVGDAHTQYHNDARGDVRYYTQALLDAGNLMATTGQINPSGLINIAATIGAISFGLNRNQKLKAVTKENS